MKRSEINRTYQDALRCFLSHRWAIPPSPKWDITDYGLGFDSFVIAMINLTEEPEYSEKLIYCVANKPVPMHCHHLKKEDLICRWGILEVELWAGDPQTTPLGALFKTKKTGKEISVSSGQTIRICAGERITINPHIYHSFRSLTSDVIVGQVSTASNDLNDIFFVDERIDRFPEIIEDEPKQIELAYEFNNKNDIPTMEYA